MLPLSGQELAPDSSSSLPRRARWKSRRKEKASPRGRVGSGDPGPGPAYGPVAAHARPTRTRSSCTAPPRRKSRFLRQDWLAGTADPTPIFSGSSSGPTGSSRRRRSTSNTCCCSVLSSPACGCWRTVPLDCAAPPDDLLFLVLVVTLHSAALRLVEGRLLGETWEYLWDGGVAGQRLLGLVFQPSAFGVFLLLSLRSLRSRAGRLGSRCHGAGRLRPTRPLSRRRSWCSLTAWSCGATIAACGVPCCWGSLRWPW